MTTDESQLNMTMGTWLSEMSRVGMDVVRMEGDHGRYPDPLKSDDGFKKPLTLDLSFSYLNTNCKLFTVKTIIIF